jgi:hypothetical protein
MNFIRSKGVWRIIEIYVLRRLGQAVFFVYVSTFDTLGLVGSSVNDFGRSVFVILINEFSSWYRYY